MTKRESFEATCVLRAGRKRTADGMEDWTVDPTDVGDLYAPGCSSRAAESFYSGALLGPKPPEANLDKHVWGWGGGAQRGPDLETYPQSSDAGGAVITLLVAIAIGRPTRE